MQNCSIADAYLACLQASRGAFDAFSHTPKQAEGTPGGIADNAKTPASSARPGKDKHKGARLANDVHQETVDSCKDIVANVRKALFTTGMTSCADQ